MKSEIMFLVGSGIIILVLVGFLVYLINPNLAWNGVDSANEIIHIQEVPVLFEVTDRKVIGINLDTDALKFGAIMRGNSADRKFTVVNPFKVPVEVELNFSEDIADLVRVEQDNFVLGVNDSLESGIYVETNENTSIGEYEGVMEVVMRRG